MWKCHANMLAQLFQKLPLVSIWTWLNHLPFAINKQKRSDAIQEDEINEPWKTLSSGRRTPQQAERLMLALYLLSVGRSMTAGGTG